MKLPYLSSIASLLSTCCMISFIFPAGLLGSTETLTYSLNSLKLLNPIVFQNLDTVAVLILSSFAMSSAVINKILDIFNNNLIQ